MPTLVLGFLLGLNMISSQVTSTAKPQNEGGKCTTGCPCPVHSHEKAQLQDDLDAVPSPSQQEI
jgi:hypothetical protein